MWDNAYFSWVIRESVQSVFCTDVCVRGLDAERRIQLHLETSATEAYREIRQYP